MGDGKKVLLPCGHLGEYVFANFTLCPVCDAPKPKVASKQKTDGGSGGGTTWTPYQPGTTIFPQRPTCPNCGRTCTEPFRVDTFKDVWHCGETTKWDGEDGCGHVFTWDSGTGKCDDIGLLDAGDFDDEEDTADLSSDQIDFSAIIDPWNLDP